jgi:hypothetical protein
MRVQHLSANRQEPSRSSDRVRSLSARQEVAAGFLLLRQPFGTMGCPFRTRSSLMKAFLGFLGLIVFSLSFGFPTDRAVFFTGLAIYAIYRTFTEKWR